MSSGYAQHTFSFEILPGGAVTLPSRLLISQEGYPELNLKAHYRTESFKLPVYYSVRLGYSINKSSGLELEFNHLKIYLENKPPEISNFSVSHGYNQLWINYLKNYKYFDTRMGLGPVIAHPENNIRDQKLPESGGILNRGYHLAGVTSMIGIRKRLLVTRRIYIGPEIKLQASWAKVDIVNGYARFPLFAIHGQLGLGLKL